MYCKKCGAEIEDGARFCPSCGGANEESVPEHTENMMTPKQLKKLNRSTKINKVVNSKPFNIAMWSSLGTIILAVVIVVAVLANGGLPNKAPKMSREYSNVVVYDYGDEKTYYFDTLDAAYSLGLTTSEYRTKTEFYHMTLVGTQSAPYYDEWVTETTYDLWGDGGILLSIVSNDRTHHILFIEVVYDGILGDTVLTDPYIKSIVGPLCNNVLEAGYKDHFKYAFKNAEKGKDYGAEIAKNVRLYFYPKQYGAGTDGYNYKYVLLPSPSEP